jgi:hypothetical protein
MTHSFGTLLIQAASELLGLLRGDIWFTRGLLKFCRGGRIVVNHPALPPSGIHHSFVTHGVSLWDCFVQQDFSVILCFPWFSPFLSSVSRRHERSLVSGQAWFENGEVDVWLPFVSHTIISNTFLPATSLCWIQSVLLRTLSLREETLFLKCRFDSLIFPDVTCQISFLHLDFWIQPLAWSLSITGARSTLSNPLSVEVT